MGAKQVLRAAACGVLIAASAGASPRWHEHVAVIDLGPTDDAVRKQLAQAIVAAGLDPVIGDGVEDALAGEPADKDGLALASAIATAKRAFGELDCTTTTSAVQLAVGLAAARQAAGLPVPELPRALEYGFLCADRTGNVDLAATFASRLRAVGGSGADLRNYPEVDAISDRDLVEVDVTAELGGAALWVDFAPHGTAPAHLVLTAGEHVIAAASGTRRGVVSGTAVRSQKVLAIPMPDQAGRWSAVAARVASWHGTLPAPAEIGWVLAQVHARAALIRHDDVVEAWGRAGLAEPPRRLDDDDGVRSLAEADRAAALIADRVQGWNDHAPDPDKPLLVESKTDTLLREGKSDEPTRWWVYAAIGGAILAGAIVIYAHDSATDTQRVELHYP